MREEFEAWHHAEFGYVIAVEDDPQQDGQCAKRWKAWQASRAALRVELPERAVLPEYTEHRLLYCERTGFNDCLERVTEALQQAGIEVAK
ncbi:hypothetical protein [Pseudomonas aeruginosa]|uniref:hypothetical protein n=1 Tax=Pseudomonas aeruginosa TaxID=287 RepID=UPI000B4DA7DB|nr:hypothetical protein [Pseudomonas aeruginosa]ASD20575.1 hypothetical protein CD799_16520 [Pseudomonas aeruginosa]MBX6798765.1 hypothetical protein [Pseudomonas aeruginosa]MCG7076986.1 hypothetical protein [Pseudomonas aeruginosa]MCG7081536.1 hypothetical protein [Pseudomonas aeruginosa]MCG7089769.1 hypothetical protein [Pseudomonas aeruginosa]